MAKIPTKMTQVDRTPILHIWKDQLLFLGTSVMPHREHHVVQDKLLVSIEGQIDITFADGTQLKTRSCLLKAGTVFDKQRIDVSKATVAIYYVAPLTQDYPCLESMMLHRKENLKYEHPNESALVESMIRVRDEALSPEETYRLLREYILPDSEKHKTFKEFDPRVIQVLMSIRDTVSENRSVREFARMVNLSESRLEKLFKDHVGVPITNYRLRYRVFVGVIQIDPDCLSLP